MEQRQDRAEEGEGNPPPVVLADTKPGVGRPPTDAERETFERVYPGLKGQPFTITDDKGAYNCWGYAIRCTKYGGAWEPPVNNPERARAFEDSLNSRGWVPSTDCKRKKGFRKIAIYCSNVPKATAKPGDLSGHDIIHAAKELLGSDWWESKDGEQERFTHPTPESIVSKKFDHLCGCWEKPLAKVIEDAKDLIKKLDERRKGMEPLKTQLDRDIAAWLDSCKAEAEQTIKDAEARIAAGG